MMRMFTPWPRSASSDFPLPEPSFVAGRGKYFRRTYGGKIKKRPSEFSCADSRLETLYGSLP